MSKDNINEANLLFDVKQAVKTADEYANKNKTSTSTNTNTNTIGLPFKIGVLDGKYYGQSEPSESSESSEPPIALGIWVGDDMITTYKGGWIYTTNEHKNIIGQTTEFITTYYRNGLGEMNWLNGNIYTGNWRINRMNGEGIMSYTNGDKYIGKWSDGMRDGRGTMIYKSGSKYDGMFRQDMKHGEGTISAEGVKDKKQKYICG